MLKTDAYEITKQLDNTGIVVFKRGPRANDPKKHTAKLKDGLVIVDDDLILTRDSFTHLYIDGFIEHD